MTVEGSDIVYLNVGGRHFCTLKSTLCGNGCSSMISAMFSGRHPATTDKDGYMFIDRDGDRFKYILNYLRNFNTTKQVCLPHDLTLLEEIYEEADYFCLSDLKVSVKQQIEVIKGERAEALAQTSAIDFKTQKLLNELVKNNAMERRRPTNNHANDLEHEPVFRSRAGSHEDMGEEEEEFGPNLPQTFFSLNEDF